MPVFLFTALVTGGGPTHVFTTLVTSGRPTHMFRTRQCSLKRRSTRPGRKGIRRRVLGDCRATSDYGSGHSNGPCWPLCTQTKTLGYRQCIDGPHDADLTVFTSMVGGA